MEMLSVAAGGRPLFEGCFCIRINVSRVDNGLCSEVCV